MGDQGARAWRRREQRTAYLAVPVGVGRLHEPLRLLRGERDAVETLEPLPHLLRVEGARPVLRRPPRPRAPREEGHTCEDEKRRRRGRAAG